MQSIGTLLSDKGWDIVAVLFAAVVVIAILIFLFRFAFGRRLHMTGGRSRQPRLGVVDAFDLDRQRQLVLVRRDNVEHLLMIGGPNDVVIESAFVRAQPSVAVPTGRDKEGSLPIAPLIPMPSSNATTEPVPSEARPAMALPLPEPPPAPASPPLDLPGPGSTKDLAPLSDNPAPAPVAAASPAPAAAPAPAASEPRDDAPAPPPKAPETVTAPSPLAAASAAPRQPPSRLANGLAPRPAATALPPRPPLTTLRPQGSPPAPLAPPPSPFASSRPTSPLPNRPMSVPLQRGTSAASLRRDPAGTVVTPLAGSSGGEPSAPPPIPLRTEAPATPAITLDSIESLEEEMAKLLGRASSDKG